MLASLRPGLSSTGNGKWILAALLLVACPIPIRCVHLAPSRSSVDPSHDSIQSYYYYRAPLIPDPPVKPLPNPDEHPFWYGDFKLRYPLSSTLVPAQYGHYFKAISGLRSIINDMAAVSYSQKENNTESPSRIWSIFSRLEKWYLGLPAALSPRNIVFPWQLKVQYVFPRPSPLWPFPLPHFDRNEIATEH